MAVTTSATPCLEVVRLCCSLVMSIPGKLLQFLDVSRAHDHCKVLRDDVYMELRRNLSWTRHSACDSRDGTRDAGQAFEFAVRDDFEVRTFSQGAYSPCDYRHKTQRLWYFVHGRDAGSRSGPLVVQTASRQEVNHEAPRILGACSARTTHPEPCAHMKNSRSGTR